MNFEILFMRFIHLFIISCSRYLGHCFCSAHYVIGYFGISDYVSDL